MKVLVIIHITLKLSIFVYINNFLTLCSLWRTRVYASVKFSFFARYGEHGAYIFIILFEVAGSKSRLVIK